MSPSYNGPIYAVAVERDFIGRHWLFGGDWGAENEIHSHHYKVELQLEGTELDRHGYLVDIVDIEAALDELIAHYRDSDPERVARIQGSEPEHKTPVEAFL